MHEGINTPKTNCCESPISAGFIALLFLLLLNNPLSGAIFTVTGANNEQITIEVTGIQNINAIINPNTGQPTNNYTYRRIGPLINFTISATTNVHGNSCDSTYIDGEFSITVSKVTGFNEGPYNTPYEAPILKTIHQKKIKRGQGTITYTYHYIGKSAIAINLFQMFYGLDVCPLDTPSQFVQMNFSLMPEPIASEILYTRQLHPNPEREDIDYWQDDNCNSCVPMGLPSYQVNASTFLPEFSDVDYQYPCRNQSIKMHRFFMQPVNNWQGMFGIGWGMGYEAYLMKAAGDVDSMEVSWIHPNGKEENYRYNGASFYPTTYLRNTLMYDALTDRYVLKEFNTNLTYTFRKSNLDTLKYVLENIKDNYQNTTFFAYNAADRLTSITDACGNTTTFTYNAQGLCSRINLANGKKIEFTYDADQRMVSNTDVYGNSIQYSYAPDNLITSFTVNGNTATFVYDSTSFVKYISSITNLNGQTTNFSLIPSPPVFTAQRQGGNVTETYHSNAYTGSVTKHAKGNTQVNRTYDKYLRLKTRTTANGITETFEYDSVKHNLVKYVTKDATTYLFAYDADNNLTEITDPNGRKKIAQYNAQGSVTAVKDWDNSWHYYAYNANGQLATFTNELGSITTYTYNPGGDISRITYPNGTFTEYVIETSTGNLLQYKNRRGGIISYTYDALNRITKMTNEDGTFKEYMYDCCSQTGYKDELGNVMEFQRSPTTRPLSVKDAENNLTAFTYNAEGKLTIFTYPDGSTRQVAYNNAGLPVTITDENGNTVQYQYDADGHVIAMTDEKGNVSTFVNTPSGRLSSITAPGSGTVQRVYDATGRINHFINARQQFIPLTRDFNGRIISVVSDQLTSNYTYNPAGNITAYAATKGTVTLVRDTVQRIIAENWPVFGQINYGYDASGNIISMQYPGNALQLKYIRNQRGFVTALVIGNNDTIQYTRNAAGDVISVAYPNQVQQHIAYNKNRNIKSLFYVNGTDTLLGFWYQFDSRENIVSERRIMPNGTGTTLVLSDTGGFFQAGNLVDQWHNNTFSHDADGNLVSCTGSTNFTMQHNSVNLPTQLNAYGNQAAFFYNTRAFMDVERTGTSTYLYCYDYRGNLIARRDSASGNTIYFVYDDDKLLAVKTNTGVYYYLTNHLGSVYALASASGQLVNTYNYNVWGQITHQQETVAQPFKYVGAYGVREVAKDFYLMKHRMYNSYLGRFLEKDPMGYKDGTNPYLYVSNNPLKYIDPHGLYQSTIGNVLYNYYNRQKDFMKNTWYEYQAFNRRIVDKLFEKPKPAESDMTAEDWIRRDKILERIGDVCSWIGPWIPGVGAGKAYADGKGWGEVILEYGVDVALTFFGAKVAAESSKMLIEALEYAKNAYGTLDAMGKDFTDFITEEPHLDSGYSIDFHTYER